MRHLGKNGKKAVVLILLLALALALGGCRKAETPEPEQPAEITQAPDPALAEEPVENTDPADTGENTPQLPETPEEQPQEADLPVIGELEGPLPIDEPAPSDPIPVPIQPTEPMQTPAVTDDPGVPETPEPPQSASVTFSISCETALSSEELDPAIRELLPRDGWILSPVKVEIEEGESVFDVLQRVCRTYGIALEHSKSPVYDSAYIEGIAHLYEFDCGNLSGWEYSVNGWYPNYGCSKAYLKDGDVVCWKYTCDLGKDIGAF